MRCLERQGKATQHNRKTKQHNTTRPKQSFFKEKLAASGGTQTHDHLLPRQHSYQLSYQGSSAGWTRITYKATKCTPAITQNGKSTLTVIVLLKIPPLFSRRMNNNSGTSENRAHHIHPQLINLQYMSLHYKEILGPLGIE